jgi:toxin CcdB
VQTNLLDSLQTTVVVRFKKLETNKDTVLTQLTTIFEIECVDYLVLTPQLTGIQRKELDKAITDIEYARTEMLIELDLLLQEINAEFNTRSLRAATTCYE